MSKIKQEWVDNIKEHLQRYFEGDDTIHKLVDEAINKTYKENEEINSTLSLGEYYNLMKDEVSFYLNIKSTRKAILSRYQLKEKWVNALIARMKDYFKFNSFGDFLLDAVKYTYDRDNDICTTFSFYEYRKLIRLNLEFSDEPEIKRLRQAILDNVLTAQLRKVQEFF